MATKKTVENVKKTVEKRKSVKLSDITGERAIDVVAEIVEPITNLAANKDFSDLFVVKKLPEGMTKQQFAMKRIGKAVPALLKQNKKDLVKILAVINDIPEQEYLDNLNLAGLISDVYALITDEEFMNCFS